MFLSFSTICPLLLLVVLTDRISPNAKQVIHIDVPPLLIKGKFCPVMKKEGTLMNLTDLQKIRRDLHQIPELGYEEFKTQAYLLD